MVKTKYDFEISSKDFLSNINRLTNQLWKLIPMRENEENWLDQLHTVILEISGLNVILTDKKHNLIVLLSKLEGLKIVDTDFNTYRKTVFETISLLRELCQNG